MTGESGSDAVLSGSLAGRRAVVTGSGGALGSRICAALAADGVWVAGLDVSADTAAATTDQLTAAGATARHAVVGLLDFDGLRAEVDAVAADWGGIDILINTAGGGLVRPFAELSLQEWNTQLERNLTSVFTATRLVLPHMLAGGWGRIVTLSSIAAVRGGRLVRHATAYASAKAGVIGLSWPRRASQSMRSRRAPSTLPAETGIPRSGGRPCWPRSRPGPWAGLMIWRQRWFSFARMRHVT
jgi:NAD(P)-dependent dehydrogenase (short-subunit alcohol dehydrogenase family)